MRMAVLLVLSALALAGCGNKPRQPEWLINADGAQERFERAYLSGEDRAATSEFARLREAVSRTAQVDLLARAELTRCAVRVASLELEPCAGFEPLRADAPPTERAYADFLAGRLAPEQANQLPQRYRAIGSGSGAGAGALKGIDDPLSRLVAAAVLLRTGRADPQVLELASDTAAGQGWRRAVLA
jgi:hypothetical protein